MIHRKNYYYGLINGKLGNITDSKDGFDIASMGWNTEVPAYTSLAIFMKENDLDEDGWLRTPKRAFNCNRYTMDTWQMLQSFIV